MLAIAKPLFQLGNVVITTAAHKQLHPHHIARALGRHAKVDWGDLCEEDRKENAYALRKGCRLFSSYHSEGDIAFWIITEADRSVTTILLPNDY
jgi:hypothetical protein